MFHDGEIREEDEVGREWGFLGFIDPGLSAVVWGVRSCACALLRTYLLLVLSMYFWHISAPR